MKISDISKAFNINSKEVITIFKDIDPEKKVSGAAVSNEEFEMFFSLITKAHQIKDIDAYTSGKTTIRSASEKAEASEEAKKPAPEAAAEVAKKSVAESAPAIKKPQEAAVKPAAPEVKTPERGAPEVRRADAPAARRPEGDRGEKQRQSYDGQRPQGYFSVISKLH